MVRSADVVAREAKIAELKQLILTGSYETLEKLEDAVDSLLWSEQDRLQQEPNGFERLMSRMHPK